MSRCTGQHRSLFTRKSVCFPRTQVICKSFFHRHFVCPGNVNHRKEVEITKSLVTLGQVDQLKDILLKFQIHIFFALSIYSKPSGHIKVVFIFVVFAFWIELAVSRTPRTSLITGPSHFLHPSCSRWDLLEGEWPEPKPTHFPFDQDFHTVVKCKMGNLISEHGAKPSDQISSQYPSIFRHASVSSTYPCK